MTEEEAVTIVTHLIVAYPRDVSKETVRAYCEHLASLPRDAALRAVDQLIATSKWLPTIAEIRECVALGSIPPVPSIDVAWSEAERLMRRIGVYRSLGTAGTPYVNRTLTLCGQWVDVCQEDGTWLRRRFAEIYERVVQGVRTDMQLYGTLPLWLVLEPPRVQALIEALGTLPANETSPAKTEAPMREKKAPDDPAPSAEERALMKQRVTDLLASLTKSMSDLTKPMSESDLTERRKVLREQLERLKVDGKA